MHTILGRGALFGLIGALAVVVPATAAPVAFTLRVEGSSRTLFEGPVSTDARSVDGHDASGAHTCDGTNNATLSSPGPTVGTAMADEADRGGLTWQARWSPTFQEFFLATIDGETPNFSSSQTFWSLYQDGRSADLGMCEVRPSAGGEVLWAVTTGSEPILRLAGPTVLTVNQPGGFAVEDTSSSPHTPIAGASVAGTSANAAGQARVSFPAAGVYTIKALKTGAVRSNALVVCVHNGSDGTCGTVAPNGASTPAPSQPVAATHATPRARPAAQTIDVPNGARFAPGRSPRLISGSVRVDSGNLRAVDLRLARRSLGRCEFFSLTLGRLRRARCGRGWLFRVASGARWSFLLGERLPAGSYRLDVVPFDTAGARGVPRSVSFRVLAGPRSGRHR